MKEIQSASIDESRFMDPILMDETGLLKQQDVIQYGSLEALTSQNAARIQELSQIEKNRVDGAAREDNVLANLQNQFPEKLGYHIESQCPLRDENGSVVRDLVSGEHRRLDFVVIHDNKIIKSVEVTSMNANKTEQLAKEDRIREAGGNFVIDKSTGNLIAFAPNVKTEVVRLL